MKKVFLLALAVLITTVCFGQEPIYNGPAGTFTWTISEDTTQAMYGCPGNNYNAEGQCEGTMQWYYHTGKVALSVTNNRTGLTYSSAQTVTGGVATASVDVPVLPGDELSYTETQQVYCPVAGTWSGLLGSVGYWEIALTRVIPVTPTFPKYIVGNTATWSPLAADCNGIPTTGSPDFLPSSESGPVTEVPTGWDVVALCASVFGHQPWACVQVEVLQEYTLLDPLPRAYCTYTP